MEIIAHRGASAYALENSREAFELALRMGADRIEFDVRTTRDGVPVVIHDPSLDRVSTGHGLISEITFSELAEVRLKNGEPILTLAEAISLFKCPLYVDFKEEQGGEMIIKVIQRIRAEGIIIGAAHPEILHRIRRLAPRIPTSLLVHGIGEEVVDMAKDAGAEFVHFCWERYSKPTALLSAKFLDKAKKAGLKVILWHEERPEELRRIIRLRDVFGVCTDMPDLARRIFGRTLA